MADGRMTVVTNPYTDTFESERNRILDNVPKMSSHSRTDSQRYLRLTELHEINVRVKNLFLDYIPQPEEISADSCLGRISSEDIISEVDLPPRTISSMDGYALRTTALALASTSNPIRLGVKGAIYPDHKKEVSSDREYPAKEIVEESEAYYVATGAPIPEGCDVVARIEDTRLEEGGKVVVITKQIPRWKNIAQRGEDVRASEALIRRGQILNASDVALLVGIGRRNLHVTKVIRVGIISVGNELREYSILEETKREDSQTIVNNYSNLISGYLLNLGARPVPLGIAKDEKGSIEVMIERGLESCDMIITIAGSSVGAKDYTPNAILSLQDSKMIFHGVKVVPIRPAGLAIARGKPIVIAPGHSVSTALTFFVLARPILNLLSGLKFEARRIVVSAKLGDEAANARAITALTLVKLERTSKEGVPDYRAIPLAWGSNLMSSLSRANGFLMLGPHEVLKKNEVVKVELFESSEFGRIDILDA